MTETTKNLDGIVLAAGASTRMGEPKALLEVDGSTFLERAVHLLRDAGCRYVVAVVNDDDWIERLADVSGAAVVINDADGAEQIDSLRLGIANLPDDSHGVMVLPVDFPRTSREDDAGGPPLAHFVVADVPRKDLAVHPELAHAPCDQLRVLGAEVEDEDARGVDVGAW
jgi:hypothetical protein